MADDCRLESFVCMNCVTALHVAVVSVSPSFHSPHLRKLSAYLELGATFISSVTQLKTNLTSCLYVIKIQHDLR
jgi:hypothetical protein